MENQPAPQNHQEQQPNEVLPAPENNTPKIPVDPDAKGPEESGWEIDGGL